MPRKCCVPFCTSGYDDYMDNKVSTYTTKDKCLQEKWQAAIPRANFKITDSSAVCAIHFTEDDIIKGSKILINGEEIFTPFTRHRLKKDAIPSIFPGCPAKPMPKKRKPPKERNTEQSTRKKRKISHDNVTSAISEAAVLIGQAEDVPLSNTKICEPESVDSVFISEAAFLTEEAEDVPLSSTIVDTPASEDIDFHLAKLLRNVNELPPGWFYKTRKNEDQKSIYELVKLMEKKNEMVFERSIQIIGSEIKYLDFSLTSVEHVPISKEAATFQHLHDIIEAFDSIPLCFGITDKELLEFPGRINAIKYASGWRSMNCTRVSQDKKKFLCGNCSEMRTYLKMRVLQKMQRNKRTQAKETTMRRKILRKVSRQRVRIQNLKENVASLRKAVKVQDEAAFDKHLQTLSAEVQSMIKTLIQYSSCEKKKGFRYEAEWLLKCVAIRIKGRKTYEFLRDQKILPLPHESTIRRLLAGIPLKFGFNEFALSAIGNKLKGRPKSMRLGSLGWDEMSILKAKEFNSNILKVDGFVDYGEEATVSEKKKNELADHALVFFFRPYKMSWVQPIAAFATHGAAPAAVLERLVLKAIIELEKRGAIVKNVVSDGAQTNKGTYKLFKIDSNLGSVRNFIEHPTDDEKEKIYFMYDAPHLFKCIRNHIFSKTSVQFQGKVVRYKHFSDLYEIDCKKPTRLCYQLTYAHLHPSNTQKMNVKLAVQVISRKVSDAFKYYRETVGEECLKSTEVTEQMVRLLNDSFDIMNSRFIKNSTNRKNWPDQRKILQELLKALDATEAAYVKDKKAEPFLSITTLHALRLTVNSIIDLITELLSNDDFKYVLTGKMNQDCIERFFGIIRGAGGCNDHPTVTSFKQLFRILSMYCPIKSVTGSNVDSEEKLEILVSYKNCLRSKYRERKVEEAKLKSAFKDKILQHIVNKLCNQDLRPEETSRQMTTPVHLKEHDYAQSPLNSKEEIEKQKDAKVGKSTVTYLCGYLLHSRAKLLKCEDCKRTMITEHLLEPLGSYDGDLIKLRDRGGLKKCTREMADVFYNVDLVIRDTVKKYSLPRDIFDKIVENLSSIENISQICCSKHMDSVLPALIMDYIIIRIRFDLKSEKAADQNGSKTKALRKQSKQVK